jgi:hypothetical protein
MDLIPTSTDARHADQALVQSIIEDGVRRYFLERHAKVGAFVDRNFSLGGSLRLHRAAVGWDIAKAPLNFALAASQTGLLLAARAVGRVGTRRLVTHLASKRLPIPTAVGREITWRLHAELLELPFKDGSRMSQRDALAETILSDPRIVAAVLPALEALARGDDPVLRRRLDAAMTEYGRSRGGVTEIATTMTTLANAARALRKLAPRTLSLGPALAATVARRAAWAGLFPAAQSAVVVAGLTGGLLAVSTVAAAFSGVVTDPVQRRLGLHQRRLHRMLDALERQMNDPQAEGFALQGHYAARLSDLLAVAGAVARSAAD